MGAKLANRAYDSANTNRSSANPQLQRASESNFQTTRRTPLRRAWLAALALCWLPQAHAEDGYDLWLRYRPVEAPWLERYRASARELVPPLSGGEAAQHELMRAIAG